MADRMDIMQQLKHKTITHSCPKCDSLAYCAVSAGKSLSACWCNGVDKKVASADIVDDAECLCRECLATINDS